MASTISVHCEISEKWSSQLCSSPISTTVTPRRPRISRLVLASPRTSLTDPMTKTTASMPRCSSTSAPPRSRPRHCCRGRMQARPPVPSSWGFVARLHRRDRLAAGVLHQDQDGIPIFFNRDQRSASRIWAALRFASGGRRTLKSAAQVRGGYLAFLMAATVSVNGRITGERDAVISVFDHGFLYGEGITTETLRTQCPARAVSPMIATCDGCSARRS